MKLITTSLLKSRSRFLRHISLTSKSLVSITMIIPHLTNLIQIAIMLKVVSSSSITDSQKMKSFSWSMYLNMSRDQLICSCSLVSISKRSFTKLIVSIQTSPRIRQTPTESSTSSTCTTTSWTPWAQPANNTSKPQDNSFVFQLLYQETHLLKTKHKQTCSHKTSRRYSSTSLRSAETCSSSLTMFKTEGKKYHWRIYPSSQSSVFLRHCSSNSKLIISDISMSAYPATMGFWLMTKRGEALSKKLRGERREKLLRVKKQIMVTTARNKPCWSSWLMLLRVNTRKPKSWFSLRISKRKSILSKKESTNMRPLHSILSS